MKKAIHWIIGLFIIVLVVITYWLYPPIMHRFELLFQNLHFQWRGPIKAGPEVVIAAIDEKSIDELGRWPWSRKTLTRLVEKLVENQVKVIGFDIVFSSPDESSGIKNLTKLQGEFKTALTDNSKAQKILERYIQESDYDAEFASVLRQSRRAVLGYFFHFTSEGVEHLSEEDMQNHLHNIEKSKFNGFIKSNANIDLSSFSFRKAYAVESNIDIISKKNRRAGYFSFNVEPDGSIRKLPLIVKYHDKLANEDYFFPPLSIRILEKYLRGSLLFKVNELGAEKVLLDSAEPIVVPTNERGDLYVNFLGKRGSFPHFSITDIIHDRKEFVPEESLKDKIVIVGPTATALEDLRVTPFDPVYPGVEVHATIIDNILHHNHIYQPDWVPVADSANIILLGILLTLLYSRIKPVYGALSWFIIVAAELYVNQWIFVNKQFWVSNVFPLSENLLIFSSLMIYRYVTEERQRKYIQGAFSQYLAPAIVEQVAKDPSLLKLGGERKVLTAFFSDVAGFSTISEQLSPEELVDLLNLYLTEMTDITMKYEGTVDKFEGDAIIAFFGAPVPFEDHARRACLVSLEMQKRLEELRAEWRKEGKHELFMRIGLNTGPMVVGNMGSKSHMDYTMMVIPLISPLALRALINNMELIL